jgi:hypothetical protein
MSIRKIPTRSAASSCQDSAAVHPKICSLLTRPLGLLGWETLEPVLLAALTTRDPLLLIGKHGTGKSFLLERLARALGLVYRFYNASLVNYDDLVGIPVPDETRSSLRYITTPTAIWDAEVVFVDELNRTRPDLQNKLFPIIHERRVQGVDLEKLRYRWAAMNPGTNGEHDEQEAYLGTEPLDPALADRFGFLIEVPDWSDLSEVERTEVLLDQFRGPHEFPVQVSALVEESVTIFREFCARPPVQLCGYFVALESQLRVAGPWDTPWVPVSSLAPTATIRCPSDSCVRLRAGQIISKMQLPPCLRQSNSSLTCSTVRTNPAKLLIGTSTNFCARNSLGASSRTLYCSAPTDRTNRWMDC